MNKVISYLNKQKSKDNLWTNLLKLLYSYGQITWLHALISTGLSIAIPLVLGKSIFWTCLLISYLIIDAWGVALCNRYQYHRYTERILSSDLLSEESSLLKSLAIEMEHKSNWKGAIFKTTSELVCEKIYRCFKDILKCRTRVSIEYIFDKTEGPAGTVVYVKKSGRSSSERSTTKRAVPLTSKNGYYSYKIFVNNNKGVNILKESQINDPDIWHKNKNNPVNVKKYIGIAISIYDESCVKFILQIDILDEFKFGQNDTDEDIKSFIDKYLTAYINIITISYILNQNKNKEIPEV